MAGLEVQAEHEERQQAEEPREHQRRVVQSPPARLTITDSGRKSQCRLRIGVTRRQKNSTTRYHIVQCGTSHSGPVHVLARDAARKKNRAGSKSR